MITPELEAAAIDEGLALAMERIKAASQESYKDTLASDQRFLLLNITATLAAAEIEQYNLQQKILAEKAPLTALELRIRNEVNSALSGEVDGKGNPKKAFPNDEARNTEVERRLAEMPRAQELARNLAIMTAVAERLKVELNILTRQHVTIGLLIRDEIASTYRAVMLGPGADPVPNLGPEPEDLEPSDNDTADQAFNEKEAMHEVLTAQNEH